MEILIELVQEILTIVGFLSIVWVIAFYRNPSLGA